MKNPISKKLKAYSLTAGSLIATLPASAEIIYTDINPDSVMNAHWNYDTLQLDLNQDDVTDYYLYASSWSIGTWINHHYYDIKCSPANNNYMVTNPSSMFPLVLSNANTISSKNNWGTYSSLASAKFESDCCGNFTSLTNYYPVRSDGNFIGVTDAYIGLKFEINGAFHYGWILVDVSQYADKLTVKSYAYNNIAGEEINAGETVGVRDSELRAVSIYAFDNQIIIGDTKGTATIFKPIRATGSSRKTEWQNQHQGK